MARTKPKPRKTEAQLEADRTRQREADLEAVNLQAEAARLERQSDIQITRAGEKREGQKVKEDSVRRQDAFAALKDSMAEPRYQGAYDAARRFERDILIRRGEGDRGRAMTRVDGDEPRTDQTDAMIAAAERIEAVNKWLPPHDWWLLMELINPSRDYNGHQNAREDDKGQIQLGAPHHGWRATVAFITGEENPNAQGAAVRVACRNLRDAYLASERKAAA